MSVVSRVGVIGAGLMGSGIAEISARAGLDVLVAEADEAALERGRGRIMDSLDRGLERAKIDAKAHDAARSNLRFTINLSDFADREVVIEAVAEIESIKQSVFRELDRVMESDDAILATNTSSLSVMRLGRATTRPERVVGLHFFNPATVLPLVEVIPSLRTKAETVERIATFARDQLGKTVIFASDQAGFTVNLLLVPYLLSAIRMYESGMATKEDIDVGMEKGCNHPIGPLRLADLVGLDTLHAVAGCLYEEFKEPLYASPPILARMVEGGLLGCKSKQGFYTY